MSKDVRDYKEYVSDAEWAKIYSNYQKRYEIDPRESDKKSARLVVDALSAAGAASGPPRILDIGCSTGNFLHHLKFLLPEADLTGGDLMIPVVEECRKNPNLKGIDFEVMDVFAIPAEKKWDVIVANAVNVYFDYDEYLAAMLSISNALRPGGTYIAYEWVYEGNREQKIVEQSAHHPNGLKFWFRSGYNVERACRAAGFERVLLEPFDIPIDLPAREATAEEPDAHLYTRTERDLKTGRRLMFRGSLWQPWVHIVAMKA